MADETPDPTADEAFHMSMRKFLKQVGVTSQQAIEAHVRELGSAAGSGATLPVRVVLTAPGPDGQGGEGGDLEHVVEGEIRLG